MRSNRIWLLVLALAGAVLYCGPSFAQAIVSEDFTGATTSNPWYYFNGACLTASTSSGTGAAGSVAGSPPGCTTLESYYEDSSNQRDDTGLVGGYNGTATSLTNWSSATALDPIISGVGYGALRFTNGCIYSGGCGAGGYHENGLIISGNTYSTDQGLDITFKTVTYDGDSYGNGASCPSGTTAYDNNCVNTATATYTCPSGYTASGSGSSTTCTETLTQSAGSGHSCPNGYTYSHSTGKCTETVTTSPTVGCSSGYTQSGSTCYSNTAVETDPNQNDGADGMSFFLMDGSQPVTFSDGSGNYGSWGGSLGYTCSNTNYPFNGLVGAYIGLGIDEYGNFLNPGDNTASGPGLQANRIGLRGAGNVSWNYLLSNYATAGYASSWSTTNTSTCLVSSGGTCTLYATRAEMAVKYTCANGYLSDYNGNALSYDGSSKYAVSDYPAISGGYVVLPGSVQIANEYANGGYSRRAYSTTSGTYGTGANPITYDLKITANGLLSLSYSYNGGAWTSVLKNQSITASNGTLPSTVRFGFAGSTGGATNIHEILCFKAAPATSAASSTTVNQQQSSKVENGSQAYFGYYDPQNWTGKLTANYLVNTGGVLTIDSTANWDASCVLTGATTCATTGQTGITAQSWQTGSGGRVILTWSGTAGIPLEWSNISGTQLGTDLDAGDSSQTADRLQFLRGDQNEEIENGGTYRNLDSVLGDIVDSSSAWVGPPSKSVYSAYEIPNTWEDKLYPTATMPENSGQTYSGYVTAEAQRLNVVYVGANDGMVHGFSAGAYDSTGTVYDTTTNTGQEVLAYMPEGVLEAIHNATTPSIDYANPQYGHAFYVDATPGTGDLYYAGNCPTGDSACWHTWLVGGLGPGGAEIYALDITTPANFSESNASTLVMGDWQGGTNASTNPGSFTCQYVANCALNLGDTYGTPTIRRLHNGDWAVIFGNGLNSSTGDAGIFILTIDSSGTQSMYYLSTGKSGTGDGIAYAHPVDMDQDHVVDYVYAGDALGNVWRFDLTSSNPQNWAVTPGPLFKTSSGQPITSDVYPVFAQGPTGTQLLLFFGTGQKFPVTETTATSYASGQQSFYGIWDWNMSAWNALNSTQFASLPAGTAGTLGPSNLQPQTVTVDSGLPSIDTPYAVCWEGSSSCSTSTVATISGTGSSAVETCTAHVSGTCSSTSSNNQYGWYINFPETNSGYGATTYEQEIYNPILVSTAIQFNSILPAIDSPLICSPSEDQGWSYALNVQNGNPVSGFFVNNGNTHTIALQTNASGSSSEVTTTNGTGGTEYYLIYQSTTGGAGTPTQIQPANNVTGYRETWIQLR